MYDLIHDSDISLRRQIYSTYEAVIFISLDKRELSVRALICHKQSQTPRTWQSAQHCFINRQRATCVICFSFDSLQRNCCFISFNLWGDHQSVLIMKASALQTNRNLKSIGTHSVTTC